MNAEKERQLVAALARLPGIGPRSAERIALHLVQAEPGYAGDPHEHAHGDQGHGGLPRDLNFREIAVLLPIAVACVAIGVYPRVMLDVTEPSAREALVAYPQRVNEWNAAHGRKAPAKVALEAGAAKEVAR